MAIKLMGQKLLAETMEIGTPLQLYEGLVRPEWMDYNGHMNVAYYVLLFDHATDIFMDYIGMGDEYRDRARCSGFVVEAHVNYQQELISGDPVRCTTQLLGYDAKRIHFFHRMYHAEQDFLAATNELILIHVDLAKRHNAPMPREILDRLDAIMIQHSRLSRPPQSGRVIGVKSKAPSSN
jgi:acyl-CoA thioester hydrolase